MSDKPIIDWDKYFEGIRNLQAENEWLKEDRDAEREGARVLAEALANANKERKRLQNDLKELGLRLKGIGEGIEGTLKSKGGG